MPAASAAVAVTSSPPDSVVGDYKIDFDALDKNHDGNLTRAEVKTNATLLGEFRAVDANRNGKLSKAELKGWM
jgi:Ca2+-binding EF-hand superfamily protein